MAKRTIAQAKQEVKELGGGFRLQWKPDYREYVVHYPGGSYFTDDQDDAIETAKCISSSRTEQFSGS